MLERVVNKNLRVISPDIMAEHHHSTEDVDRVEEDFITLVVLSLPKDVVEVITQIITKDVVMVIETTIEEVSITRTVNKIIMVTPVTRIVTIITKMVTMVTRMVIIITKLMVTATKGITLVPKTKTNPRIEATTKILVAHSVVELITQRICALVWLGIKML